MSFHIRVTEKTNDGSNGDLIEIPVQISANNDAIVSMETLKSQFGSNASGLKYNVDCDGTNITRAIRVSEGTLCEPDDGWEYNKRVYYVTKKDTYVRSSRDRDSSRRNTSAHGIYIYIYIYIIYLNHKSSSLFRQ